jgi:Cation transport ATPase (P-type)
MQRRHPTEQDGRWDIVGDPTEGAMLVVAAKAGLGTNRGAELPPRVATIPFSSERQYMATLHRDATQGPPGHVVLLKGAVERMLDLRGAQMDADGTVGSPDRDAVLRAADELTSQTAGAGHGYATCDWVGGVRGGHAAQQPRADGGCRSCSARRAPPRPPQWPPATPQASQ